MTNKNFNVLVVDDDKNFTFTLCEILRSEGYQCREAHSVEDAQDILIEENFDCILSDVKMPKRSGPDLYNYVKKNHPNLPFVLMTAYTSSDIIEKALRSGVLAALQKPVNIRNILDFLSKLNQGMQAAVICEEQESCDSLSTYLGSKNISVTFYQSTKHLINSNNKDYTVVFVDVHLQCKHYSSMISELIDFLPKKTIIIFCDYKESLGKTSTSSLPEKIHLIVLPRERTSFNKIDKILEREFKQYAKQSIQ